MQLVSAHRLWEHVVMKWTCALVRLLLLLVVGAVTETAAQSNLITNPSFETNSYGTFPGYSVQPGNGPITGWSGSQNFGLNPAAGVSAFANNGSVPNGTKVAFLQNAGSRLWQTVSGLSVGQRHELRFHCNAREGFITPILRVTVNGMGVYHAPVCAVGGSNSYRLSAGFFVATNSSVVLAFEQLAEGDATVLIDNIVLRANPLTAIPPYTTTSQVRSIRATANELLIKVEANPSEALLLAELHPFGSKNDAASAAVPLAFNVPSDGELRVPRFECHRDRLYSGFIGIRTNSFGTTNHAGEIKFAEDTSGVERYTEQFPLSGSKKGLQVQMTGDALALGIKHAAINLNLSQLIDLAKGIGNPTWQMDGETFSFHQGYLDSLQVKQLSDSGVVISFIVLYLPNVNQQLDSMMVHPGYNRPESLPAFNTKTVDGVRHFRAAMEFLTDYYSRPDRQHGRVVNFIIGNEVTAHWYWYNMGSVTMEAFAEDYLRTVRLAHTAVRRITSHSRVYISLDHHWNSTYGGDPLKAFPGRAFIDRLNSRAKAGGDFEWHVAHHPYPENLFEPRTWLDATATPNVLTTSKITFKNIELLPQYLSKAELLYRGSQRRVILSEQGFHAEYTEEAERRQAAAYCYAYRKVAHLPGIDSFILHRHVDHAHEGGLNLGLWRRVTNSIDAPDITKPIYQVFKQADTTNWQAAFQFALAEIGISDWNQIITWSPPALTLQPVSQTGVVDDSVTFNIAVSGTPNPGIQWYLDGDQLTNDVIVSGVTSTQLKLTNLTTAFAGNYSVSIRNGHGSVVSTNALLTVLSQFQDWQRQHFTAAELQDPGLSAPGADPDSDGIANAVEFAFAYNPRLAEPRALNLPTVTNDGGTVYLTLSYRERAGTTGIYITNQHSPDLFSWSTNGMLTRVLSEQEGMRTMEVRKEIDDDRKLFLRSLIHLKE